FAMKYTIPDWTFIVASTLSSATLASTFDNTPRPSAPSVRVSKMPDRNPSPVCRTLEKPMSSVCFFSDIAWSGTARRSLVSEQAMYREQSADDPIEYRTTSPNQEGDTWTRLAHVSSRANC